MSVDEPEFVRIDLNEEWPGVSKNVTVLERVGERKVGGRETEKAVITWVMPPASVPATSEEVDDLLEVLAFFFFDFFCEFCGGD